MNIFETFKIAVSDRPLPSARDLQLITDKIDFLFPIKLLQLKHDSVSQCAANVDGRHVNFTCERMRFSTVIASKHLDRSVPWRFAYGFRGTGGLLSSVIAGVTWQSYAYGTRGSFYSPNAGFFKQWDAQKKLMDALLASELGRPDLYLARYPEDRADQPERYDTLVTRISIGETTTEHTTSIASLRKRRELPLK